MSYKIQEILHDHANELAQLKAEARENYDFLIQSRDFILNEFCQLQVQYGEQKHEIRKLKAELEQAKHFIYEAGVEARRRMVPMRKEPR